jgi:PBP1b-binding outer membrane lipoprotein LpoB
MFMKQMLLLAVAAAFLGGCASVASEPVVVAPAAEPVAPVAEAVEAVVAEPAVAKVEETPVQPEPVVTEIPATASEAVQTQGEVAWRTAARGQGAALGEFSMTIQGSGRVQTDAAFDGAANAQGAAQGESRP